MNEPGDERPDEAEVDRAEGPRTPRTAPAPGFVPRLRALGLRLAWAATGVVATALVAAMVVAFRGGWYLPVPMVGVQESAGEGSDPVAPDIRRARTRLAALAPRGVYLVVDTHRNRLAVRRGDETLREMACSTGSGLALRDPETGRVWVFETPLGERTVERKVRDPMWMKPDWAFVEEGFRPPRDPQLRADDVSLGDYGLYLGDGYIIHGTLFQTLLGRPLTHGCIRLGTADLEYVWRKAPLGTRVYLY